MNNKELADLLFSELKNHVGSINDAECRKDIENSIMKTLMSIPIRSENIQTIQQWGLMPPLKANDLVNVQPLSQLICKHPLKTPTESKVNPEEIVDDFI